jgi:hypothetical protein
MVCVLAMVWPKAVVWHRGLPTVAQVPGQVEAKQTETPISGGCHGFQAHHREEGRNYMLSGGYWGWLGYWD